MQKIYSEKLLKSRVILVLFLYIAAGSNSCALRILQSPPAPTVVEEDQFPSRVAILPFVNQTSTPEAGTLVRRMFYNFFSSLNYRDLEPFVIDDNLKINNL